MNDGSLVRGKMYIVNIKDSASFVSSRFLNPRHFAMRKIDTNEETTKRQKKKNVYDKRSHECFCLHCSILRMVDLRLCHEWKGHVSHSIPLRLSFHSFIQQSFKQCIYRDSRFYFCTIQFLLPFSSENASISFLQFVFFHNTIRSTTKYRICSKCKT